MDTDYMSAINRGDIVTAQRMVDEAVNNKKVGTQNVPTEKFLCVGKFNISKVECLPM